MATFDPTVGIHLSPGGGPSMGGAPQLLAPGSAGAAVGHILSTMEIKRDANAAARGTAAAHEHLGNIANQLQSFKAQHIIDDDFDSLYAQELDKQLEQVKTKSKYEPNNEKEELAYRGTLQTFRQQELVRSFGESMKAHHDNQLNTLNFVLNNQENLYTNAVDPNEAQLIGGEIFRTLLEASRPAGKFPGVITREQGRTKYMEILKRAEIGRLSASMTERELFELGHKPNASISIVHASKEAFETGNFGNQFAEIPLSDKEKEGLVAFALKRQSDKLHFEENTRKYSEELTKQLTVQSDRQFYDNVIASNGANGPQELTRIQSQTREDGTPLFSGPEIGIRQKFIDEMKDRSVTGIKASDRTVYLRYIDEIYPKNPNQPLDPTLRSRIMNDKEHISNQDAISLVGQVNSHEHQRLNRDYSDFADRRSQGVQYLKAILGGDAFIEFTKAGKNFYADLLGAYHARINQRYDEALVAGNGLRSIKPQDIVNQIVEERSNAMNTEFFPAINQQVKSLSMYVNRVPKDIPDDAPVAYVLEELAKDAEILGTTPKRGLLPQAEYIHLSQLLRAAQQKGFNMGMLRKAMHSNTSTPSSTSSGNTSDGKKPIPSGSSDLTELLKGLFTEEKQ